MIDDLILRVPNVERRCAITCLVIDAQDCLPVRTRLGRSECLRGTCEPAKWKATLRNDHIAWQGHEPHTRLGETEMDWQQPSQKLCNYPSVSSLDCCSVHVATPRTCRAVQSCGIHVSDSLDWFVADGRFSLTGLLKPSHTRLYIRSTRCG